MAKQRIYSVDVMICGTLYVRASSVKEAREIANDTDGSCLEVEGSYPSDIEISGARFDDPDLPDVSLSPAMTVHGRWKRARPMRADD